MANNSNLFTLANQIRKETGMSQKEAFAEARKRMAEQSASAEQVKEQAIVEQAKTEETKDDNPVVAAKPAGKKRGNYVRDDAWKAKHAADMKAYWASRKAAKVAA